MHTTDAGAEDRALVARIARSDRVALEQLYRRHAPWLLPRLESRCGDPDLADLALQDTFLAVWRSARRYQGDGVVAAWLWGIAIRRLVDQLRRRRDVPVDPTAMLTARVGTDGPSAESAAIDGIADGDLGPALERLSPELRATIIATVVDGLTTREAAALLGIPPGTVKTRTKRARELLRSHLEEVAP